MLKVHHLTGHDRSRSREVSCECALLDRNGMLVAVPRVLQVKHCIEPHSLLPLRPLARLTLTGPLHLLSGAALGHIWCRVLGDARAPFGRPGQSEPECTGVAQRSPPAG